MSAVSRFEIVLLLMAFIVGLDLAARRLQLPRAAALIFGGIGLALIPRNPIAKSILIWSRCCSCRRC